MNDRASSRDEAREHLTPEMLQAMRDLLARDAKRQEHIAKLRGEFLALALDIEHQAKLVLANLLLVPPDRRESFHEVMFQRMTMGTLYERLRDLVRQLGALAVYDDFLAELKRVVEDRNVMAHYPARWQFSPSEDGDEVLMLKSPLSTSDLDQMFDRCHRCLETAKDLERETRWSWYERYPAARDELLHRLQKRERSDT